MPLTFALSEEGRKEIVELVGKIRERLRHWHDKAVKMNKSLGVAMLRILDARIFKPLEEDPARAVDEVEKWVKELRFRERQKPKNPSWVLAVGERIYEIFDQLVLMDGVPEGFEDVDFEFNDVFKFLAYMDRDDAAVHVVATVYVLDDVITQLNE